MTIYTKEEFISNFQWDFEIWETNNGDFLVPLDSLNEEERQQGKMSSVAIYATRFEGNFAVTDENEILIQA